MEDEKNKISHPLTAILFLICLGWCAFMAGRIVFRIQSDRRFFAVEDQGLYHTDAEEEILFSEELTDSYVSEELDTAEEIVQIDREQIIREIQNYEKQIPLAENAIAVNKENLHKYEEAFEKYRTSIEDETLREEMVYRFYASSSSYILMVKEDMLSTLGYTIQGTYEPQSEMDKFTQSLEGDMIEGISSQIADGAAAQIISGGISGAVDGIRNSGSVSGIIENTWEGIQDGFASGIQEAPKEFLNAVFGVDLFGILEFFDTVNNMDEVPDYLIVLLKRDISNYGNKLQFFLEDEYVTSDELSKAVYWYKQYWDAVEVLNQLSGQTLIDDHWVSYSISDIDMDYNLFKRDEYVYRMLVEE